MPTFFRSDGWVKATTGAAIPGAQIYVATQPANVAFAPPTPLATIYEDPDGLVPITQPILTDGFGHYDFYVLPGTYTVVIALGGVIQQVYPDQSIGVASGGGSVTSVGLTADPGGILSVSGSPIISSGVFALSFPAQAANTALMGPVSGPNAVPSFRQPAFADLSGNIAIAQIASGSGASSSTFLRGDNIWASAGGTSFSTAGQGGFFGPGLFIDGAQANKLGSSTQIIANPNEIRVTQFCLLVSVTIRKVSVAMLDNLAFGNTATFGIYNASGTSLLVDGGQFLTLTSPTVQTNTLGSPVVLPAGVYLLAQSSTTFSSSHTLGITPNNDSVHGEAIYNTNATRYGVAASVITAGQLPASLGAITPQTPDAAGTLGTALPFFEP